MEIDAALREIESKYDFTFKEKQLTAIKSIIDNKDTFIVLPTGYGKSKIYVHLPEIYELVNNVQGIVLVISPLQCFRDVSATLRFGHSTFRPQTISAIVVSAIVYI